jgi:hypothetical protein
MRWTLGLALLAASGTLAFSGEPEHHRGARLVLDPAMKIAGLSFSDGLAPVESRPLGDEIRSVASLRGTFAREGWTLLWQDKAVPRDPQGVFRLEVTLTSAATVVEFLAVGPAGEVEPGSLGIYFEDWKHYKEEAREAPPKTTFFTPELGMSFISYSDTRIPNVSLLAATAKAAYTTLLLPPRWDFGASAYLTLLPFPSSAPSTMRFLGVNARMGYVVPSLSDPWRLSIMGGLYYTTMFVSPATFGFVNMAGPQLFPVLRRGFRNRDSAYAYLKFSPVTDGTRFLALYNREFALGAGFTRPLEGGHSIAATIDLASLALQIQHVSITSTSVTLGAGYGF